MAGIEPASERFDPRKSTSVAGLGISPQVTPPAKSTCSQPFGPESPLSRSQRRHARHSAFVTPDPTTGRSSGWADAASRWRPAAYPIALSGERHGSIGSAIGTCFFALIYRVRRLSARIPGPASSVEACHPRFPYYSTLHRTDPILSRTRGRRSVRKRGWATMIYSAEQPLRTGGVLRERTSPVNLIESSTTGEGRAGVERRANPGASVAG
jgi:hypothetical protein